MDTSNQAESVPASDSAAESNLVRFVAENRQHLPPLPERPKFENLQALAKPETDLQRAEREAREAQRAELRRKAELRERFHAVLLAAGQRYRECSLENFACVQPQQRKVISALREYVAKDCPESVILYGPVGTGKDHLAFAVCRHAIDSGKTVSWMNGQKWFGLVRDAMDTDRSEASLVAEFTRPDVLCLSDPLPPVGPLTQFQATMLYRLVDARYSRGVPTICTLNIANDTEADERMGAATWDRLCHDAWRLSCNWPSYRRPSRDV